MSLITDGWTQSARLDIVDTNIDSTLTNFPVYLNHTINSWPTGPDDIFAGDRRCEETGADVRFSTDALGVTEIPKEILFWDNTAMEAYLFVKVPSVSGVATTMIYMWWGKSDATHPARTASNGSDNVWRSEYALVAHLKEASGTALDSTSNNETGTYKGGLPTQVAGTLYKAQDFVPAADRVDFGDHPQFEVGGAFSCGMLVDIDSLASNRDLFGKRKDTAEFSGWELLVNTSGEVVFTIDNVLTLLNAPTSGAGIVINTKYWIAVTYDGSLDATGVKIYVNGVLQSMGALTDTLVANVTTTFKLSIGSRHGDDAGNPMDGQCEEGWIYQGELSAAWIKAMYHNQNNVTGFISVQSVTDHNLFPTNWDLTKYITLTSNPDYLRRDFTNYIAKIDEKQPIYVGKEVDFWATVGTGGGLRLATGLDGSGRLSLDVDVCEDTNEILCAWGKITTLTKTTGNNKYYLFYKSNNAVAQPYPDGSYGKYSVHSHIYDCTRHHCSIQGTGVTSEFKDVSGSGNNGTGTPSPIRVRGICGYGQEGDGVSKKIVLTDTGFPTGAAVRTMWSWIFVQIDATAEDSGLCYGTNTTGNRFCIQQRWNGIGVHFSGNFRGQEQQLNGWHLVAGRVPTGVSGALGTTKVEMLIDGDQIFPVNLAGSLPDVLNTILSLAYIGAATGGAANSKIWDECGLTTQYIDDEWLYLDYHSMFDSDRLWGRQSVFPPNDCCDELKALIINNGNRIHKLRDLVNELPREKLYSIIADIKRDVLRGMNRVDDGGRKN